MKFTLSNVMLLGASAQMLGPVNPEMQGIDTATDAGSGVPTAMFHGLGDACLMPGDKNFDKMIATGTNAHVECIDVGAPSIGEVLANFETVAEKSCEKLAKNENFQGEFNVIGLSQGGLLARYIVEECKMPGKVRNMVTLGGPHMGVDAVPHCFTGMICDLVNDVVRKIIYEPIIQDHVAPAGYFRDTSHMDTYEKGSVFLPALNNEIEQTSDAAIERKKRFSALNGAMLVMFSEDTMIYPKETAWFQTMDDKIKKVLPIDQTDFYNKDYIGLKALTEAGKVKLETFKGDHLQFTKEDIENTIIPFLNQ